MTMTNSDGLLEGVFCIERSSKIGTGATARRSTAKANYYAREKEDGMIELLLINDQNVPFGSPEEMTKEDLLAEGMPMPDLFKEVVGNMREVQKSIARGDKFRARNETFTAEFEYSNALNLDEQNVRANFGIGLCLLARDEEEKAKEVFDRIVKIDTAFEDEHKHLFNEYGIALRKKKLVEQAVDYYERALELTGNDENLWYNLGRALFDMEEWTKCGVAARRCLAINPHHPEGKKMLAYLTKKELI